MPGNRPHYGRWPQHDVSALTRYLDFRSGYVNMLYHNESALKIIRSYINLSLSVLFSAQYSSYDVIRMAVKHVGQCGTFWRENYDLSKVRGRIAELSEDEKLAKLDLKLFTYDINSDQESSKRRFMRTITLNGMLLPSNKKTVLQVKGSRASFREVFRYKNIIYFDFINKKGVISKVSKIKFFYGIIKLFLDCIIILLRHSKLARCYKKDVNEISTKEFWNEVYK